jgi:uncharacterized membrane protein YgdD (TMEM256/DUF423 family)
MSGVEMKAKQIRLLLIGAIFGFLAVVLGAFGAHALKEMLGEVGRPQYDLGVRYAFIHVFAIITVGLAMPIAGRVKYLNYAAGFFVTGIVLFSGSLVLLALSQRTIFAMITPFGGLAFLLGWGLFIYGLRTIKT